MTRKVSSVEAKRRFSELLNRVQYRGERVLIHKRGKPAAALVSIQDLDSLPKILDGPRGHILECVGLFADLPEWEHIMEEVVASRARFMPRKVKID